MKKQVKHFARFLFDPFSAQGHSDNNYFVKHTGWKPLKKRHVKKEVLKQSHLN